MNDNKKWSNDYFSAVGDSRTHVRPASKINLFEISSLKNKILKSTANLHAGYSQT